MKWGGVGEQHRLTFPLLVFNQGLNTGIFQGERGFACKWPCARLGPSECKPSAFKALTKQCKLLLFARVIAIMQQRAHNKELNGWDQQVLLPVSMETPPGLTKGISWRKSTHMPNSSANPNRKHLLGLWGLASFYGGDKFLPPFSCWPFLMAGYDLFAGEGLLAVLFNPLSHFLHAHTTSVSCYCKQFWWLNCSRKRGGGRCVRVCMCACAHAPFQNSIPPTKS